MNKYEIMFIVKPDLEETVIKNEAESLKKVLTNLEAKIVEEKAPMRKNVTITQVGNVVTFLLSQMSDSITGQIVFSDNGYNIMGN